MTTTAPRPGELMDVFALAQRLPKGIVVPDCSGDFIERTYGIRHKALAKAVRMGLLTRTVRPAEYETVFQLREGEDVGNNRWQD